MQTRDVFGCIDSGKGEAVEMLKGFASWPSVSASGQGIRECALLAEGPLAGLGASPKIFDNGEGNPEVAGGIRSKRNPRPSPNENLRLDLFVKGMKWVASAVDRFAAS